MNYFKKFFAFNEKESKMDFIINVLMFINMTLIGSDRISFKVMGVTIRLVQFTLLAVLVCMLLSSQYKVFKLRIFVPFVASNIISTIFSFDQKSSVMYIIWTVFNFIAVYCLFYTWSRNKDREKVMDFWLYSYIIQGIYVTIQYIIGLFQINDPFFTMQVYMNIYRPAIWFYEPSYLATYFSIYFSMSYFLYLNNGRKKYLCNTMFAFMCLLMISSSTGYLGIGLVVGASILLTWILYRKIIKKNLKTVTTAMILILIVLYSTNSHMFNVFAGRLVAEADGGRNITQVSSVDNYQGSNEGKYNIKLMSSNDSEGGDILGKLENSNISGASGERISSLRDAINIFIQHPLIGIGPNAYPQYSGKGLPPTNVTLEILVNLGIAGLLTFVFFVGAVLYFAIKAISKKDIYSIAVIMAFIIFIILLQANQNYLRLYLWMHMGIISGICGRSLEGSGK